jgi:HSP20 family protein
MRHTQGVQPLARPVHPRAEAAERSQIYLPVDVKAEEDAYIITTAIPGANPEDLRIEISEDTITLSGEFQSSQEEGSKYLLRERPYGRFKRSLKLPTLLDADSAEAKLEHGVLTVKVLKSEKDRPKQIKVTAR